VDDCVVSSQQTPLEQFQEKPPGGLVAVDLLHFVWLEPVRGIFG
jgi:hypothetical protein